MHSLHNARWCHLTTLILKEEKIRESQLVSIDTKITERVNMQSSCDECPGSKFFNQTVMALVLVVANNETKLV